MVVVGLGGMGAATAYQLSKAGVSVIGIDRFVPPHELSASYGNTRISRQAVAEAGPYVPLVLRSHEIWRDLERLTDETILDVTGVLIMQATSSTVGHRGVSDFLASTAAAAKAYGIEHRLLGTDDIRAEFPQFRLDEEHSGYYEPGAGFIRPEAAIRAQLQLAQKHGTVINTDEQVLEIISHTTGVTVRTDKDIYSADMVVVAAGAWIPDLLDIPELQQVRIYRQVVYWFEITNSYETFLPDRFPVFIWENGTNDELSYGFPAVDGRAGGLKVSAERFVDRAQSADDITRNVSADEIRHMFQTNIYGRIPALGPQCVKAKACMYAVTPDFNFIIDYAPETTNVMIVSACSGHGFKHSAAIGESIAQLITTGQSDNDLTPFTLNRLLDPR